MKHSFISNGEELINELQIQLHSLTFNQIKTIFRKKDIKVNGKRTAKSIFLKKGDLVEVFYPDKYIDKIPIIYEDNNIAVIFKKQGLETTIKDKVFEEKCVEELFPGLQAVHRLDKNTEGLLILAKNKKVFEEFIKIFKLGQINKFYKAICYGNFIEKEKLLTGYAIKKNNKTIIYDNNINKGSLVKTYYKIEQQINQNLFLLNIQIFTGFTHQIRAHLNTLNCFVLGDNKYGKKTINRLYKVKKQLLCAYKLSFNIDKNFKLSYLNNKIFEVKPSFSIDNYI